MEPLSFDAFWSWLEQHSNCLIRVGTPDAVLYDDDACHWYAGRDRELLVVQLIRGKRLSGEVVIDPERVTYVIPTGDEQGEHGFEAIHEGETERIASYAFVLTHGMDETDEDGGHPSVVH